MESQLLHVLVSQTATSFRDQVCIIFDDGRDVSLGSRPDCADSEEKKDDTKSMEVFSNTEKNTKCMEHLSNKTFYLTYGQFWAQVELVSLHFWFFVIIQATKLGVLLSQVYMYVKVCDKKRSLKR